MPVRTVLDEAHQPSVIRNRLTTRIVIQNGFPLADVCLLSAHPDLCDLLFGEDHGAASISAMRSASPSSQVFATRPCASFRSYLSAASTAAFMSSCRTIRLAPLLYRASA